MEVSQRTSNPSPTFVESESFILVRVCMLFRADDERVYAYLRFETGDEMSRRKKFAFVTWIGPSVSPLKKAKVSTDKAFVKAICYVSLQCVNHSCTLDLSLFKTTDH